MSKHDTRCDLDHVMFLKNYKIKQNRKNRYKKHLTIHTKQKVNEFQIKLQTYYNQFKEWAETKKI